MSTQHHDTGVRVRVERHSSVGYKPPHEMTLKVMSMRTTKSFHGQPGTFTLEVFPHADVMSLRPNDWIAIYGRSGDIEELLLWGCIDGNTRARHPTSAGSVEERIRLVGTDYTKALLHTELSFDPLYGNIVPRIEFLNTLSQNADLTKSPVRAGTMVQTLLNMFRAKAYALRDFLLPNGRSLFQQGMLDWDTYVDTKSTLGAIFSIDMIQLEGNLWDTLQQYSDPTHNYLFTDYAKKAGGCIDNVWSPVIRLGELPFTLAKFDELPKVEIDCARDVESEEIGFSDRDTKNWVTMYPAIVSSPGAREELHLTTGVRIDAESIRRHGIRRHQPQSMFVGEIGNLRSSEQTDSMLRIAERMADKQAAWFTPNEHMLSGSYNLRFMPWVKPGVQLVVNDTYTGETILFFVESVSHHWSFSPPSSGTVVQVTRGLTEEIIKALNERTLEVVKDAALLTRSPWVPST